MGIGYLELLHRQKEPMKGSILFRHGKPRCQRITFSGLSDHPDDLHDQSPAHALISDKGIHVKPVDIDLTVDIDKRDCTEHFPFLARSADGHPVRFIRYHRRIHALKTLPIVFFKQYVSKIHSFLPRS